MNQETKPKSKFNPQIAEYFVGLSLLMKGFEELPHFSHYPFSIGFIFFAGAFIIVGTRFHHLLEKRIRHSGGLFHILEGMVEFITAIILFQGLKKTIPFFLAFIGLVYIAMGVVEHFETETNREVLRSKLRFWLGFTFITFACTFSVFNALTAQKLPVYIVCSIMVIVGVLLVLSRGQGLKGNRDSLLQRIFSKLQRS